MLEFYSQHFEASIGMLRSLPLQHIQSLHYILQRSLPWDCIKQRKHIRHVHLS